MTMKLRGGVDRVTILRASDSGRIVRQNYDVEDPNDGLGLGYVVRDQTGRLRRGEITEHLGGPKKQSKMSRALDKRIRKAARRNLRSVSRYLTLHDRSNRLKKNGWMRDLGKNLKKAIKKR
jgi:Family of unknown function (DUF6312)